MPPTIHNPAIPCLQSTSIPSQLRTAAEGARKIALLISPFVAQNAIKKLLHEFSGEIILVTRDSVEDFSLGVSDIRVWPLIWERKGRIYCLPDLHTKYYRFDNAVFIGSANATDRGLQFSKSPNEELLVKIEHSNETKRVEINILNSAHEATKEDYQKLLQEIDTFKKTTIYENMLNTIIWKDQKKVLSASERSWLPLCMEPQLHYWIAYRDQDNGEAPYTAKIDLKSLNIPKGIATEESFISFLRARVSQMLFRTIIDEMFLNNTFPERPYLSYGTISRVSGLQWSRDYEIRRSQINGVMNILCYTMGDTYFDAPIQRHSRLLGRKHPPKKMP